MAEDSPKVEGGLLSKPYPIKTRGDVNRSRVLPAVRQGAPERPASEPAFKHRPGMPSDRPGLRTVEQPKGALDYVGKRNRLMKEITGGRSVSGKR